MNNTLSSGNEPVAIRIGVDIGGTFTDGVAQMVGQGRILTAKELTDVVDPSRGVALVVSKLLDQTRRALGQGADIRTQEVVHGTTLVTNAILERKGVKTGLVVTRGTGDALQIAREIRYDMYDIDIELPEPLVPRTAVLTVGGRLDASGNELQPITPEMLDVLADEVEALGVESIGICTLHSYIAPVHEERIAAHLRKRFPELSISMSSRVAPEPREYERMSTVAANAYVQPIAEIYLRKLQDSLKEVGASSPLNIMVSSGGFTSVRSAADVPIVLLESGPAGGVLGALNTAAAVGVCDVLTFDMGGTTAKASMIENGRLTYSEDYEVGASMSNSGTIAGGGGYSLRLPVINIAEVGAGGGSIVSIDKAGALKIGPESAGASPGPACYGVQDEFVTVTDANVLLGYLNPHYLAGGTVKIDRDLSYRCLIDKVMKRLGLSSVEEVAYGIHTLANEKMVKAIKAVTTYRGRDPRDFSMIAFGGNGGIHGVGIARSLGMKRVIVPVCAGVFSAVGLAVAERKVTVATAYLMPLREAREEQVNTLYAELHEKGAKLLHRTIKETTCFMQLDLRAKGQAFEITVDLGHSTFSTRFVQEVVDRFIQEYEIRYCHKPESSAEIEVVALRMTVSDATYSPPDSIRMKTSESGLPSRRNVYFGGGQSIETPVVNRAYVQGKTIPGPLIIEEYEGTTIIPPDANVSLDDIGNIVIDLDAK